MLPRKFNDSFREDPEASVLRDLLADVNSKYSDVKGTSSSLVQRLRVLVDQHQAFSQAVQGILPWLGTTETTLNKLLKEPISADPAAIEKQIERLQVGIEIRVRVRIKGQVCPGCH